MEDYEVRDVMARNKYPQFEIECTLALFMQAYHQAIGNAVHYRRGSSLEVVVHNVGSVYALYVSCIVDIPVAIADKEDLSPEQLERDEYVTFHKKNTRRDVVDVKSAGAYSFPKHGPSWYDPILPGLSRSWDIPLDSALVADALPDAEIVVKLHADNAFPITRHMRLRDMALHDTTTGEQS